MESSNASSKAYIANELKKIEKEAQAKQTKSYQEIEVIKNASIINSESSKAQPFSNTDTELEFSENELLDCISNSNPNILKLTKNKWLSEGKDGSPNYSYVSLSTSLPCTSSSASREFSSTSSISDKNQYLSRIISLDKEHNMFGLSNLKIENSQNSRKCPRQDAKPVFHQTTIVQRCCAAKCCRNKSNSDLPMSLKCGSCRSCLACVDPCSPCPAPCPPPKSKPRPPISCTAPCPSKGKCSCNASCPIPPCCADCPPFCGLKITLNKKMKFEPSPVEITPKSSCILQKPYAARPCTHCPPCVPPTNCFPYLMPCFWPARPGAPCNTPARCFHNPPCPPHRKKKPAVQHTPPSCPKSDKKCVDEAKKTTCPNKSCPGKNPALKTQIESNYKQKGDTKSAPPK